MRPALLTPRYIEPMLPTLVAKPPEGDGWVHEIKYDGYRKQLALDGAESRAFTRNGHAWSRRYWPLLAQAAAFRCKTAIIDGEAIVQNERGISDLKALPNGSGSRSRG
jgi:ATP-dependent DNA ligase